MNGRVFVDGTGLHHAFYRYRGAMRHGIGATRSEAMTRAMAAHAWRMGRYVESWRLTIRADGGRA